MNPTVIQAMFAAAKVTVSTLNSVYEFDMVNRKFRRLPGGSLSPFVFHSYSEWITFTEILPAWTSSIHVITENAIDDLITSKVVSVTFEFVTSDELMERMV